MALKESSASQYHQSPAMNAACALASTSFLHEIFNLMSRRLSLCPAEMAEMAEMFSLWKIGFTAH